MVEPESSATPFDPFEGYFRTGESWTPIEEGLLDTARAKQLIKTIEWGSQTDVYSYQQAFAGKSGPLISLQDNAFHMISSYDYLGLIGHPDIEAAAIEATERYGTGTGGVRLLTGTTDLHFAFEKELAEFKGTPMAITFSSGFLTNLAVISTLLGPEDLVLIDSKAHRSLIDACRLARVPVMVFQHNTPVSLQQQLETEPLGRRTLIVVEGIYSMDGDICPLPEIVELKKRYGVYLMVDEAHSFGVLGTTGKGVDEHFGIDTDDVDIWMGTLSKAIPSNGGYVAGAKDLIIYLQHASAPFVFSAALCPAAIAAARAALRVLQDEPERLTRLRDNAEYLRENLMSLGFDTGASTTPIIPVMLGDDESAYTISRGLFKLGIIATPVVQPAVKPGEARLRLCATAAQDTLFLDEIVAGFREFAMTPPTVTHADRR